MKGRILIAAAALATAAPLFVFAAQADDASPATQPGFAPDTGQINPGHAAQPWSAAAPLPLNEQQRQQIYQAVMADTSPPAAETAKLKPADSLTFQQRRDMRPLPESLGAIDGLRGLQYLKGKDKVLLVRPSTGIIVDEVAM